MSVEKYMEYVRSVGKNLSREDLLEYLGELAVNHYKNCVPGA